MFAALVAIHVVVLWRATGGGSGGDNTSTNMYDRGALQREGPIVIPFVVSMTGCGEDPFMEGVSYS